MAGESITLSVIAIIIAGVSALASWFMAIYSAFAKAKLKAEIHKEYANLSETRRDFWETLNTIYRNKRRICGAPDDLPEKLYNFTFRANPPYVKGSVAQWVKENLKDPKSTYFHNKSFKRMWELVCFVYPEDGDVDNMFTGPLDREDLGTYVIPPRLDSIPNRGRFHSTRADLAWFWDKWMPLLRTGYLTKRYDSAKVEVYLLVWLELALAQMIGQPGKGKTELFKLAKKFESKR